MRLHIMIFVPVRMRQAGTPYTEGSAHSLTICMHCIVGVTGARYPLRDSVAVFG